MRKRISPPEVLPVSLDEAKAQCNVNGNDFDTLLQHYINTATYQLEKESNKAFMPQTWQQDEPCFHYFIKLKPPPVISVESITYYDENNDLQTLDPSAYRLASYSLFNYIELDCHAVLPTVYNRSDAVQITYNCGSETVEDNVKQAILLMVATWFRFRENENEIPTKDIGLGVDRLLGGFASGEYV